MRQNWRSRRRVRVRPPAPRGGLSHEALAVFFHAACPACGRMQRAGASPPAIDATRIQDAKPHLLMRVIRITLDCRTTNPTPFNDCLHLPSRLRPRHPARCSCRLRRLLGAAARIACGHRVWCVHGLCQRDAGPGLWPPRSGSPRRRCSQLPARSSHCPCNSLTPCGSTSSDPDLSSSRRRQTHGRRISHPATRPGKTGRATSCSQAAPKSRSRMATASTDCASHPSES